MCISFFRFILQLDRPGGSLGQAPRAHENLRIPRVVAQADVGLVSRAKWLLTPLARNVQVQGECLPTVDVGTGVAMRELITHAAGDLEGVFEQIAHQVRDRHAERLREALDLLLQRRRDPGVKDPLFSLLAGHVSQCNRNVAVRQ
jgi:hypothetical protein